MRIVLLPSAYAPAIGGVEELTARLARRLRELGDEVEVWTHHDPPQLPTDEVLDAVRVRRFALPMPRAAPRALVGFSRAAAQARAPLLAAADAFRPDVLHVQCFSANGAYATWLANAYADP